MFVMVDRKTAIARGLKRYYTGKLCPKGHDCERSVSNCECVECSNLRKIVWNKTPSNKERQLVSKRRSEYAERSRKLALKWRHDHLDHVHKIERLHRQNNPEKHAAKTAKRNIAKRQRIPAWANMEKIQEFYTQAAHLTHTTGHKYHVDHKIPLRGKNVSGLHVEDNLQVILATDNCRKNNKYMVS